MSPARLLLALALATGLSACVMPFPTPRITEVNPVNGRIYEPLPDDTEVELYLAKECRVAKGTVDAEFPIVSSVPDARLIGVGRYYVWGGDKPQNDPNYPFVVVLPMPIGSALKKIENAAKKTGGEVVVFRVRTSDTGYFEIYRKDRGPGDIRTRPVRPADP